MKLIFASSNQNKIREIKALLPQFEIMGLSEVGINEDIPEPGETIEENSFLKATYVSSKLNDSAVMVFADDSGLEVFALSNAPGVHSARYSGEVKNDNLNNEKLLKELLLKTDRRARFVTVITLLHGETKHVFRGEIVGTIAHEARGKNGFGYDPLFIPHGYRSTFAELSAEQKNAVSHRAKAVQLLVEHLTKK